MLIGWLEKRICGGADAALDAPARRRGGFFASVVGLGVNALLFAIKLAAGMVSGSVSIMADAFNNLSDASSSVISLIGFKLAGKPADAEHPFGHGRYEYLSALLVAVMILVIGVELLISSARRLLAPKEVNVGAIGLAVLVCSILLKLWLAAFDRRMGKRLSSGTLAAAADDSRNDVLTTSAVLAGALIARFTGLQLDAVFGAGVAAFILSSGVRLLRETLAPILGAMPDVEELNAIRAQVLSYPGVLGVHDLMVHDYGPGQQFASVHVEMSAGEDPIASHEVIDRIERDFLAGRGIHMVVHYDPVATDDPRVPLLRALIERELASMDPRLSAHDVRIVPCEGEEAAEGAGRVLLDCLAPYDAAISQEELNARLSAAVSAQYPHYSCQAALERGRGQNGLM